MGKSIGRSSSGAPHAAPAAPSKTQSSTPAQQTSKPQEPQQESPQISDQQRKERIQEKKASGRIRESVYRSKLVAGGHRGASPAAQKGEAPKMQSSKASDSPQPPASPRSSQSSQLTSAPQTSSGQSPTVDKRRAAVELEAPWAQSAGKRAAVEQPAAWASPSAAKRRGVELDAPFSPEVRAEVDKVKSEVNTELAALNKKYPIQNGKRPFVADSSDQEKIKLYEPLAERLKTPAGEKSLTQAIADNKDHPLYKNWGATRFSSFVALSDANLAKSKAPTYNMKTMERAALLGYSTGDYKTINPALRGGSSDAYLNAYAKEVRGAMEKIPDYNPTPGKPVQLYRAIYPEKGKPNANDWAKTAFVKGNTYSDAAFASTGKQGGMPGEWNLVIQGTKGAKDINPYSAWPGEGGGEVLVLPGQKYKVDDVVGKKVMLIPE